ncbi:hypothetical protein [Streptomyces violaceusniger]|uniref:hypothetical protein n=1 Tax=Streptomyces violaceusniger TaxID=68280 RepID=UPI00382184B7
MSTRRDDAMTALRDWSTPGRRAHLIAAAWRAGTTNITALAEAARVTRPTVYADLRSEGIDPDHRPKGSNMITILEPLNIDGITGNYETADAEFDNAMRRWKAAHPAADPRGEEAHAEGMRLTSLQSICARYADVRDRLAHEQVARAERDRLLHLVEIRWEALSTAANWLAAHHAYVLAVDDARIAIDMWQERAESAVKRPWAYALPNDEASYHQILAAGHPALDDALAELDRTPAETAEHLRANLDQAHKYRKQLAAETLGVTGRA